MSNIIKRYGNQVANTKTRERFAANYSHSPNPISISKQIQKQSETNKDRPITNNITVNRYQPQVKSNLQNMLQSKEIKVSGELFGESKPSNNLNAKSTQFNPYSLMNSHQHQHHHQQSNTRTGNFNPATKHQPKNIPRKSPMQIPISMQSKYLQSKKDNRILASKNSLRKSKEKSKMTEKMSKTFNIVKNNQDRSLSPITKKKDTTPKLSPYSRPYMSKSPIPGKPSLIDKYFKRSPNVGFGIYNLNQQKSKTKTTKTNTNSRYPINNVHVHYPNQRKKDQSKVFTMEESTTEKGQKEKESDSSHHVSDTGAISNNINENMQMQMYPPNQPHSNSNNSNSINNNQMSLKHQIQKETKDINQHTKMPSFFDSNNHSSNSFITEKSQPMMNNAQLNSNLQQQTSTPTPTPTPTPTKVIKRIKDIFEFTHVGFDGEEDKENNQDVYFIYKNFAGNKDALFMSVWQYSDGHGVEGHEVSGFIKKTLPGDMSLNLKNKNLLKDTQKVHDIIIQTFIEANNKLIDQENINSTFSGSTCVSVIYTPERLIVPNIGDSRVVMGRFTNNEWKGIDLSRDHKPTEKDEESRIIENEGRIQPFIEDGEYIGPPRVWIQEEDVPGLAMTRSFGDRVAATVGVISEPEIKEFDFQEEDKFMLIASDGVWEFIESTECINLIKNFYLKNDLKGCCQYLYDESKKRWMKEEEVVDDITMILVVFE